MKVGLAIEELLDKQALYELLVNYCKAIDEGDADLLASVYEQEARHECDWFVGGVEGFVASVFSPQRCFDVNQHVIANAHFHIDEDLAAGESRFFVHQYTSTGDGQGNLTSTSGVYHDRFVRRNGEWRIVHRRVVTEWRESRQVASPLRGGAIPDAAEQ